VSDTLPYDMRVAIKVCKCVVALHVPCLSFSPSSAFSPGLYVLARVLHLHCVFLLVSFAFCQFRQDMAAKENTSWVPWGFFGCRAVPSERMNACAMDIHRRR
jgi:hypothetical protein